MRLRRKTRPMRTEYILPRADPRFAYAAGRIGVMETRFLSFEQLMPFADNTMPPRELHQILDSAGYPENSILEDRIEAMEDLVYERVRELSGRSLLPTFIGLERDFHNLKWFMKNLLLRAQLGTREASETAEDPEDAPVVSTAGGAGVARSGAEAAASAPETLTGERSTPWPTSWDAGVLPYGSVPPEELWTIVQHVLSGFQTVLTGRALQPGCDLRPVLHAAACEAYAVYHETQDLSNIAHVLDRIFYKEWIALTEHPDCGGEAEFFRDWIALKADIVNLQIYLRLQAAEAPRAFLRFTLVPGGIVSVDALAAVYPAGEEETLAKVYRRSRALPLVKYAPSFLVPEHLRRFNRDADNLLTELTRRAHRVPYSAEVVVAYWRSAQMELRNLRLLLSARDREPSFEEARSFVRNTARWEVAHEEA